MNSTVEMVFLLEASRNKRLFKFYKNTEEQCVFETRTVGGTFMMKSLLV